MVSYSRILKTERNNVIREMRLGDVEKCIRISLEVRRDLWQKFEKEHYSEELLEQELQLYSSEMFARFISDDYLFAFVAEDNGEIVGLAIGRYVPGGLSDLVWICVDMNVQKKGVGKELMDKVIEASKNRGCHKLFAYTVPWLVPSIDFYKKMGFIQEAYMKKHWMKLDFVMMSKWLE